MPNALLTVDLEGRIVDWNPAAERLFGWTSDDLVGRPLPSVPGEEQAEWRDDVARIIQGETLSRDHPRLRRDGSRLEVKVTGAPLRDSTGATIGVIGMYEDIADRKRAEREVFQAEERSRTILGSLAEGIVVQGGDGAIELCNEAAERLLGLTAEQMTGRRSTDPQWRAIHEDGSPFPGEEHPAMVSLRTGEAQSDVVMGVHHPDGSLAWISINARPLIHDPGEKPYAVVASFFDITQLVAAREAEEFARRQLEAIIEASPAAVAAITPDNRVVLWNRAAESMFGWTADEVLGKPLPIVPGEEETEFSTSREMELSGKPFEGVELRRRRKDGTPIDVAFYTAPIHDAQGEIALTMGVLVDVTEQRRLHEDAMITRFFELSRDPLTIGTVDGYFVRVNPAFEQALGWTAEELYAAPSDSFVHPDDRPLVRAKLVEMKEGTWAPADVERRQRHKDGGYRLFRWRTNPPTAEGLIFGTCRDVTEERRREEEILALNARLTAQADDLTRSNAELESFAYSISHDLRAPLRSIAGFTRSLFDEHGETIGEAGRADLERVLSAATRMATLIDDLLSLARISSADLARTAVDLAEPARRIMSDLHQAAPDRVVELAAPDRLEANGDPTLLQVLLQNLLENAWKFTSPHTRARIELGETVLEGEPAYYVRDDGVGFDSAYADKLFSPFQRLHSSADFPGTGVGLASVRRIVERHGGICKAEGAPELGATFTFTLGPKRPVTAGAPSRRANGNRGPR